MIQPLWSTHYLHFFMTTPCITEKNQIQAPLLTYPHPLYFPQSIIRTDQGMWEDNDLIWIKLIQPSGKKIRFQVLEVGSKLV